MQTYELAVTNRAIRGNSADMTLVRTSVGIDQVHVLFDNEEWLDFPVTITFAQGDEVLSQTLIVSEIQGSDDWVAEATVTVPYEVIDMVGSIRVTLQGTDSDGRHIITAKGSPLSVEEAGDVVMGDIPDDAPTVDQWHQAYADAQTAINEVRGIINNLQSTLDQMVEEAKSEFDDETSSASETIISTYAVPATEESLGLVMVGQGLDITEDGILSAEATNGITEGQAMQIANLASLAYYCFDTRFDEETGLLRPDSNVKATAIPIDGTTIKVGDDGKLCLGLAMGDGVRY